MFTGYFAREFPGIGKSEVCYYDHGGLHVIQEYYRNEPVEGEQRKQTCLTVADPIEEGRRLVGLLNGGRDFARIARSLEVIADQLKGKTSRRMKGRPYKALHAAVKIAMGWYTDQYEGTASYNPKGMYETGPEWEPIREVFERLGLTFEDIMQENLPI